MSSFHCIMTFSACKYSRLWLGYCLSVFAVISKALQLSCFINDSTEVEKKSHQDRMDLFITFKFMFFP